MVNLPPKFIFARLWVALTADLHSWRVTSNSEVNAMNDYSLRFASILRDRSIGDDGAEDRLAAAWA
jgi:hypothetical protein